VINRRLVLLLALVVLGLSCACLEPPTVTVQDDAADGITDEELDDLYTVLIQPTREEQR